MNKKITRGIVGVLAGLMAFGGVGCKEKEKTAPDYSASTLKFDFYGYTGPTDGTWWENDIKMTAGEDFRTVERLKEYKDAGMTIYLPQSAGNYNGGVWETSDAKMVMDRAQQAGLDKVILTDNRIQSLSSTEESLIGEGKSFATEAELDAVIAEYMAPYRDHPVFYGVMLRDEPSYTMFEAYGQVYKSIKRVCPEAFVQANLLPMYKSLPESRFPVLTAEEKEELTDLEVIFERYRRYLKMFLDNSGADYLMYDQYPMNETSIYDMYIPCLQIAAEVAKEYGVKLFNVTQTMTMKQGVNMSRYIKENDAYWLNNMLVGFGVKQISYFTYWTKQDNNAAEWFYDNGSFINRNGTKTELYSIMQQIMAEEQKLAPTVLNFDYVTSNVYRKVPCVYNASHVNAVLKGEDFQKLDKITVDKEVSLVTELYDDEKNLYMYMLQNAVDPINNGVDAYQTITADFDDSCTHAVVFKKGERSIVKLEKGGILSVKQRPGHAVYVIPY